MAIAEPNQVLTEEDLNSCAVHARRLAGNFGFTAQNREDIQQDLALDLLERLPHFNATKAKRGTFVKRCIKNRISKMIRANNCQCRDHHRLTGLVSVETETEDESCDLADGIGRIAESDRLALRLDMEAVIASLPTREREICTLLPLHAPFAISKLLGCSKQEVYAKVRAIRQVFTAAGITPCTKLVGKSAPVLG